MPYTVRKTDGSIIATIPDGTIDYTSTSLFLIGRNAPSFGTDLNTDLVFLLENFASTSPPSNMLQGQLWYDNGNGRINVFDGNIWRPVGAPFVSPNRPASLVQGDLWIDTANQQLNFYDGINLLTAGPAYTKSQGRTGWIPTSLVDTSGNGHVVAEMYVSDRLVAIFSQDSFAPQITIPGFPQIYTGLQFNQSIPNNNITASVVASNNLIEAGTGNYLNSSNFYRLDLVNNATAKLNIVTNSGMSIGSKGNLLITADSNDKVSIKNVIIGATTDFITTAVGSSTAAIRIQPAQVSFYPDNSLLVNPVVTDFNSNVVVRGTLTVIGETVSVTTQNLKISDKVIEIASTDTPSNATADISGISVPGGTDGDKTLLWKKSQTISQIVYPAGWWSNDNVVVATGRGFYVNQNQVLSQTTLGSTVVGSSLTSVGALTSLTAAQFSLTSNTLSVATGNDFNISVPATQKINLTNSVRITNVADPVYAQDVSTRNYVDTQVGSKTLYFSVNTTGFANPNVDVVPTLTALCPPSSVLVGTYARVLCESLSFPNTVLSGSVSYPTPPALVQASPSGTVTVLTAVSVTTTIPTTNISVAKVVKIFRVELVTQVATWVYQSDVTI